MKLVLSRNGLYEAPASALTPHRLALGRVALSHLLKKGSTLARFMNITPVSATETTATAPPQSTEIWNGHRP